MQLPESYYKDLGRPPRNKLDFNDIEMGILTRDNLRHFNPKSCMFTQARVNKPTLPPMTKPYKTLFHDILREKQTTYTSRPPLIPKPLPSKKSDLSSIIKNDEENSKGTPGPGAYDHKFPNFKVTHVNPTPTKKRRIRRDKVPGPGAYDPEIIDNSKHFSFGHKYRSQTPSQTPFLKYNVNYSSVEPNMKSVIQPKPENRAQSSRSNYSMMNSEHCSPLKSPTPGPADYHPSDKLISITKPSYQFYGKYSFRSSANSPGPGSYTLFSDFDAISRSGSPTKNILSPAKPRTNVNTPYHFSGMKSPTPKIQYDALISFPEL